MDPKERDLIALLELMSVKSIPAPEAWSASERQAAVAMISKDFIGKAIGFTGRGVPDVPLWLRPSLDAASTPAGSEGVDFATDVLIICPLHKELVPALLAILGEVPLKEDLNIDGHKVYKTVVEQLDGKEVRVTVTVVARARNTPMALATERFIRLLRPEAVLLTGIGGGPITRTELGDVVIANEVIDVAGGRAEPGGRIPRDQSYPLPRRMFRLLESFPGSVRSNLWREQIRRSEPLIKERDNAELPPEASLESARWQIMSGTIVAGEQLVADGSLPELVRQNDQIRSCDMEGSGFAQACTERKVEWAVFRGITDYGDPDKTDKWQAIGAFAAAHAAISFVKTEFRLAKDITSAT